MNQPGKITVPEGIDVYTVARVTKANGTVIDQSDVTGGAGEEIIRKVFDIDLEDPAGNPILNDTLNKTAVIFNALQTDGFAFDSTGYNFRDKVAGSNFAKGGHTYKVEYSFTVSGEGTFYVETYVTTRAVMSA